MHENVLNHPSYGAHVNGSTGSRLLTGNFDLHEEVEGELARFFEAESALLFNSGYDANIGLLSSVPQRGDLILYDELCHASIRDMGYKTCVLALFSKRNGQAVWESDFWNNFSINWSIPYRTCWVKQCLLRWSTMRNVLGRLK